MTVLPFFDTIQLTVYRLPEHFTETERTAYAHKTLLFPPPAQRKLPEKGRYTFIDIETTGLKRDATILYLIGCGWHENDDYHIIQWF